jgi:hypothetical protein
LNGQTSKSGYFDNCATRVANALDTLKQDLTYIDRLRVGTNSIFPISVEAQRDPHQILSTFGF